MTLRNELLLGLTLVRRGRVVPLLVPLHHVSERLIPFLLFLGVFLLPLKNGRRLCRGSGGLLGFVLLEARSARYGR